MAVFIATSMRQENWSTLCTKSTSYAVQSTCRAPGNTTMVRNQGFSEGLVHLL